ncbi:SLATT domain-containing protein [Pseudarthrobacter sp. CC4]|uniref:SLATT domain-containing protein n=1 Tax=Pseudarthrobacter TaxID=1742993 RepID=UPI002AA900CF|nr:SLATT domain-containing protein [Pseudarthrobacter oxydans]WPU07808.1 SLATT domain-containing protein [Pseudarthrobacter oxydans]
MPQELVSIGEELSRIEENARWSSQTQFEQGKYWRGCNLAIGIPAGVLGVASGGAGISEALPIEWVGWAALVAALLSGTATVLTAERRAQRAQSCANAFLDVQEDARRLLLVDLATMEIGAARDELRALSDRYSEIRHTADAPASRFYELAGRNIRNGGQSHAIDRAKKSTLMKEK